MLLLGINCGFGNTDCGKLPKSAIDLETGWLEFERPKTGIMRRVKLWPETVEALRVVLAKQIPCKNATHAGLVFRTRLGQPWVRFDLSVERDEETGKMSLTARSDDAIAKTMRKLLDKLGIYRPGLSFYTLRHNFETIGGGSKDQVAVDAIMGHADGSMAAEYREQIEDDRLEAVTDHVRRWLFPEAKSTK
jgi:integrase